MSAAGVRSHPRPKTDDTLAIRLRNSRTSGGMTQVQLAGLVHLGLHRLGDIERAHSLPTPDEVGRWCWATGCDDQSQELIQLAGLRRPAVVEYSR